MPTYASSSQIKEGAVMSEVASLVCQCQFFDKYENLIMWFLLLGVVKFMGDVVAMVFRCIEGVLKEHR